MILKTKALIVILIISVFLLSSCEVYQTLYGQEALKTPSQNTEDRGTVKIDMEVPSKETDEEMSTETDEEYTSEGDSEIDAEVVADLEDEEIQVPQTDEETDDQVIEVKEEETPIVTSSDEKPVVVSIEETEEVSLVPQAQDPDSDTSLVFTFTSPLDDNGQWLTTYGDNGEYTVTITASDGELTTTKDVLIIVSKKEETPTIDLSRPIENALMVEETEAVDFSSSASDLNNDLLSFSWKLDGAMVSEEDNYVYQTTYDDAGTHTVKVEVSDGTSSASKIWSIDVKNVNREPLMETIDDVNVKETETIVITVHASDEDNDNIEYSISSDKFKQDANVFTWVTDYSSSGTYDVTLTASDGTDTTKQTIKVAVDNVNRAPVITDIVQKK